jgi:hypothetical protein
MSLEVLSCLDEFYVCTKCDYHVYKIGKKYYCASCCGQDEKYFVKESKPTPKFHQWKKNEKYFTKLETTKKLNYKQPKRNLLST